MSSLSSEGEMVNLVRRMEELRLWDRCRGLGSQKSKLCRLAFCCGLLNSIQYGGQDDSRLDEEKEGLSWCWVAKPLCSPVSTQFSRLNPYCQTCKHRVSPSVGLKLHFQPQLNDDRLFITLLYFLVFWLANISQLSVNNT